MRRVWLTVAVAGALLLASLAATVSPAYAFQGPPGPVITNPANWGAEFDLARGLVTFPETSAAAPAVAESMASVGLLTGIGLSVGALGAGLVIGGSVNRWFHVSCHISGFDCDERADIGGPHEIATVLVTYGTTFSFIEGAQVGPYWKVSFNHNGGSTIGAAPDGPCVSGSNAVCAVEQEFFGYQPEIAEWVGSNGFTIVRTNNDCVNGGELGRCGVVTAPPGAITVDSPPVPYTGQPALATITPITTDPGSGSPEADRVRTALTSGNDLSDIAAAKLIDPTYEGPEPEVFEMPDCEGLTYADCLSALEALGFVGSVVTNALGISDAVLAAGGGNVASTAPAAGTGAVGVGDPVTFNVNPDPLPLELQHQHANEPVGEYLTRIGYTGPTPTFTVLPPELGDPGLGPDQPVRWRYPVPGGGTVTVPVPRPGDAPGPLPRVPNDPGADPPEIFINPPDFPPIGGDGGGGDCPCDVHGFDFGPLTGINYGDKFPFGVLGWIGDQWALLDVGAIAPSITVTIPAMDAGPFHVGAIGPYGWDFSSEAGHQFDPIIALIRTGLTWLLWLGGLWYLGSRLLGIRGAPAGPTGMEGVDE